MSQEQEQNNSEQNNSQPIEIAKTGTSSTGSLAVDLLSKTEIKPHIAEEVTYDHKTNRLLALSHFIKSVTPFIWAAVILIVIIPLVGKGLIGSSLSKPSNPSHSKTGDPVVVVDKRKPDLRKIDQAIVTATKNAHTSAENFASKELDAWVDELMARVDGSFLNWYFNYFNQKKMEFSSPFIWLSSAVTHWINTSSPPPGQKVAENFTETFQREFANRVLIPKAAQLKLEGLTYQTVNLYVSELSSNIDKIQSSYQFPQGQWERYLNDIAFTINGSGGIISNLSLKFLTCGSSYLFTKAMIPVVGKVGSKVTTSLAGKGAAKMAAKTGGAVAAKVGAQFLDPIVAVGIIIWDVWDYHHTVEVSKPVLREALLTYLQELKTSLLKNSENGIMTAIKQVEDGIYDSIHQ